MHAGYVRSARAIDPVERGEHNRRDDCNGGCVLPSARAGGRNRFERWRRHQRWSHDEWRRRRLGERLGYLADRHFVRAIAIADRFDLRNEAVTAPRQSLDVTRRVGVVVEHLTQLLDVRVQAVLEVNEGVVGPEMAAKFFARHQLAGATQEKRENSERLALQLELNATLA